MGLAPIYPRPAQQARGARCALRLPPFGFPAGGLLTFFSHLTTQPGQRPANRNN
jgi:hypothetical protein